MRATFNATATLKRLSAYSGGKSTLQAVANVSYDGFIKPKDEDYNTIKLKITGQAYEFSVEGVQDIKPTDILTITPVSGSESAIDYSVRGVSKFDMHSVVFTKCILEKTST